MPDFNPVNDIPNLDGKVCLVTGANSGLGEAIVAALACHNPAKIYLAARSHSRAEAALSRIKATSDSAASANIEILDLDLASFNSIKAAAARVNGDVDRLDLLHLNGGISVVPHGITEDGYELQFGTNYVGHALLTKLLMPKLLATTKLPDADVRIVSITSVMHKFLAPKEGIVFDSLKTNMKENGAAQLYAQSMLAKTLFSHELAKRYPQIKSTSVNPGGVKTNVYSGEKEMNWIIRNVFLRALVAFTAVSPEVGSKTQLWCSFSKDVKSGSYYEPVGKTDRDGKLTRSDELSAKLWEWTEKELQPHSPSAWPTS